MGTGRRCEFSSLRMLRIIIDQIIEKLANVNDSNEIDDNFDVLNLDDSIKLFRKFYNKLCQIIQSSLFIDSAISQTENPSCSDRNSSRSITFFIIHCIYHIYLIC